MLFLIRGKLQIEWDLTFNSVYKLIILLTYLHSNQSLPCSLSYQCNLYKQHLKSIGCGRWACLVSDTTGEM